MIRLQTSPLRIIACTLGSYLVLVAVFLIKPRVLREVLSGVNPVPWHRLIEIVAGDWSLITVVAVGGLIFLRSVQGADPLDAARRMAIRWGWLLLLTIWVPVTLMHSSGIVDGVRYFWAVDDQMISLIYARNFVEGQGLSWAGIRLEGYSNPLWVAWMMLIILSGIPTELAPLVLLLSTLLFGGVLLTQTVQLVRRFDGGAFAMIAAVIAVALTPFALGLARGGWEAVPLAALTVFVFCRIIDEHRTGVPTLSTGFLLGVIALVRIDGMVISAVLGAGMWLGSRHRMRAFSYGAIGALLPIAMFAFRYFYFGDWMPNTVYLKTTGWPGRIPSGVSYALKFCVQMAPALALAIYAVWRRRLFGEVLALSLCVVMLAQVAYAGGDYYYNFRMLLPLVPILFAMGFVVIERFFNDRPQHRLVAGAAMFIGSAGIFPDVMGRYASIDERLLDDIRIAKVLAPICGDERVAEFDPGVPFYFARCNGIDFLGKIDRHIAHGPSVPGDNTVAHNKYDYDYTLGILRPEFVVAPIDGFPDEVKLREFRERGVFFPTPFYGNQYFIENCQGNLLPSSSTRKIYHCDWKGMPRRQAPPEWVGVEEQ